MHSGRFPACCMTRKLGFQDNKLVKMALDRTASEKSNHILVFLLHEAAGYVKLE